MPMSNEENVRQPSKPYERPTVIRVHVDPQQELLQATACAQVAGRGIPACDNSPGT
jgi:hypothetical protein